MNCPNCNGDVGESKFCADCGVEITPEGDAEDRNIGNRVDALEKRTAFLENVRDVATSFGIDVDNFTAQDAAKVKAAAPGIKQMAGGMFGSFLAPFGIGGAKKVEVEDDGGE